MDSFGNDEYDSFDGARTLETRSYAINMRYITKTSMLQSLRCSGDEWYGDGFYHASLSVSSGLGPPWVSQCNFRSLRRSS